MRLRPACALPAGRAGHDPHCRRGSAGRVDLLLDTREDLVGVGVRQPQRARITGLHLRQVHCVGRGDTFVHVREPAVERVIAEAHGAVLVGDRVRADRHRVVAGSVRVLTECDALVA